MFLFRLVVMQGFFSMFGLAGPVPGPECRCLSLAGSLKPFLFLKVMGLETKEVNELMTLKYRDARGWYRQLNVPTK